MRARRSSSTRAPGSSPRGSRRTAGGSPFDEEQAGHARVDQPLAAAALRRPATRTTSIGPGRYGATVAAPFPGGEPCPGARSGAAKAPRTSVRGHGRPPTAATTSHLAEVPLFTGPQQAGPATCGRRVSDEVSYKAGRILVDQGRTGHEFFLILDGRAIVRRNNRKIATLGPGQYFGELAPPRPEPRSATVVAETAYAAPRARPAGVQRRCSRRCPSMAHKILATMAARLRRRSAV